MPNSPINSARLPYLIAKSWFYTVLGVLGIGYAGYAYMQQREFLVHAVHVQGTIVGDRHSVSVKGHTDRYGAIFTFADATGKTWKVTDRDSNYKLQPNSVGQTCNVLYPPDSPTEAQLEMPDTLGDMMGYGMVFGVGGVISAAVGVLNLRWHYATLRQRRAADGNGIVRRDPPTPAGL